MSRRWRSWAFAACLLAVVGCPSSPEDGRARGGGAGAGADGGNYPAKPIRAPSKIDWDQVAEGLAPSAAVPSLSRPPSWPPPWPSWTGCAPQGRSWTTPGRCSRR